METSPTQVKECVIRFGVWNGVEKYFLLERTKLIVQASLLFEYTENELNMVGKGIQIEGKKLWNSLETLQKKVSEKIHVVRDAFFADLFHTRFKNACQYEDISVEPNSSLWKDLMLSWKPKKNITLSVTIDDRVLHKEIVEVSFGQTKDVNIFRIIQDRVYEIFPKNDVTFADSLVRLDYNSHDKNFKIRIKYTLSLVAQATSEERENEQEDAESDDVEDELMDRDRDVDQQNRSATSVDHSLVTQNSSGRSMRDNTASKSRIQEMLSSDNEEEEESTSDVEVDANGFYKQCFNTNKSSKSELKAFYKKEENPSAFYFRLKDEGELRKKGEWTAEEERRFLALLQERKVINDYDVDWGMLSKDVPYRVGFQCVDFYRKLILEGKVVDKNYFVDSDGKVIKKTKDGKGKARNSTASSSVHKGTTPPKRPPSNRRDSSSKRMKK